MQPADFSRFFYTQSLLALPVLPVLAPIPVTTTCLAPIRFLSIQQRPAHNYSSLVLETVQEYKAFVRLFQIITEPRRYFLRFIWELLAQFLTMREIVHIQAGQCGNQIGAKVRTAFQSIKRVIYFLNQWLKYSTGSQNAIKSRYV